MPNDCVCWDERRLSPTEAVQRAADMVSELREHCDDYGRLMQQRGGEAQERAQRVRRHLRRMESSPVLDVRPRHNEKLAILHREGGHLQMGATKWIVNRALEGGTWRKK